MVVDAHELAGQSLEYVEHAPLLGVDLVKVQFCHYHVDVVEVVGGQVLEGRVLVTFAVNLEDQAARTSTLLDHPQQGVVSVVASLLGHLTHAYRLEVTVLAAPAGGRS